MAENIRYATDAIADFYRSNRCSWDEFYLSEQYVFERLATEQGGLGRLLDVGCACGGLGQALCSRFQLTSYTGVDINEQAVVWAKTHCSLSVPSEFYCADVVSLPLHGLFDTVVSLSCADWNIETERIIDTCWQSVAAGGTLVLSLRLTPACGINNFAESYQYINFNAGSLDGERANYVVLNGRDALKLLHDLQPQPSLIGAYGYWGTASATAVTPYDRLVFAVFYLRKGTATNGTTCELRLPVELFLP